MAKIYPERHWYWSNLNSQQDFPRAALVGFQIIASGGTAIILTTTLPSTLAALFETDVATATATYSIARSFFPGWGVTMVSIVFNGRVNDSLTRIIDPKVWSSLADGEAYAFFGISGNSSTRTAVLLIKGSTKVIDVHIEAIRSVGLWSLR